MKTIWNFASGFVDLVDKQPLWLQWSFWTFFIFVGINNGLDILKYYGVL